MILSDFNIKNFYNQILHQFNVGIKDDELEFYKEMIKFNPLSQKILHTFYSKFFDDSASIQLLTREQSVTLLVILKKFLQLKGQVILPQICTAQLKGKYKENVIKNCKFVEKYKTSDLYPHIEEKFKYAREVSTEDPVIMMLSTMINSSFTWVDYDPEINGRVEDDLPMDLLISEFMEFMLIV